MLGSNISKSGRQFFARLGSYFFLYHVDQPPKQLWFGKLWSLELTRFYFYKEPKKSHFYILYFACVWKRVTKLFWSENRQKGVMSIFSKTAFVVTKIFQILAYGGDNLSHPYTHVFGKIFVAASDNIMLNQTVTHRGKIPMESPKLTGYVIWHCLHFNWHI